MVDTSDARRWEHRHRATAPEAADWDERYRAGGAGGRVWSGRPNPTLVDEVADLAPGRALDLGCGEGADAIWLAARGWTVVAVDFAAAALERGPGGTLLVVAHSPLDLEQTTVGRPPDPALYATAQRSASLLDPAAWEVAVAEERARVVEVAGEGVTVHDAVLVARRRAA